MLRAQSRLSISYRKQIFKTCLQDDDAVSIPVGFSYPSRLASLVDGNFLDKYEDEVEGNKTCVLLMSNFSHQMDRISAMVLNNKLKLEIATNTIVIILVMAILIKFCQSKR